MIRSCCRFSSEATAGDWLVIPWTCARCFFLNLAGLRYVIIRTQLSHVSAHVTLSVEQGLGRGRVEQSRGQWIEERYKIGGCRRSEEGKS